MSWTRRALEATIRDQMSEYLREVGRRVATLREAKGLTQEDLARSADVATRTVSRIENGENELRGSTLRKFAAALGATEDELRGTPPGMTMRGAAEAAEAESERLARIESLLETVLNQQATMIKTQAAIIATLGLDDPSLTGPAALAGAELAAQLLADATGSAPPESSPAAARTPRKRSA